MKQVDKDAIRRWRKRGFYAENALVKLLKKNGYSAVRVPVSNPSLNPLPDIMARKNGDMYAFEVKNAKYYAYFPKQQIEKLFRFLNELIPTDERHKHAVIAAHLGKRWIFREIGWRDYAKDKLPEKARILKRDRGNFEITAEKKETVGPKITVNVGPSAEKGHRHPEISACYNAEVSKSI